MKAEAKPNPQPDAAPATPHSDDPFAIIHAPAQGSHTLNVTSAEEVELDKITEDMGKGNDG